VTTYVKELTTVTKRGRIALFNRIVPNPNIAEIIKTFKIDISKSEQDLQNILTFFDLIYDQYLTNSQKYGFNSAPDYIFRYAQGLQIPLS